ncbi:MAG: 3'(2'),5'-bisphosphate nucleotidase [Chloroflexi bacterium]|nr:3'(2'),5'-bisphosphate nucleotidase [Chloroflexota bacterium]
MKYERERQVALRAVTQAAELCIAVQNETAQIRSVEKGDRSPVTVADFGSQALICRALNEAFPDDCIVAEEDSRTLREPQGSGLLDQVVRYVQLAHPMATSDDVCQWIDRGDRRVANRFWALDPIDGTKGFLRREQYAIALALIVNGAVEVAILGCPALPMSLDDTTNSVGVVFVAQRGRGALTAHLGQDEYHPIHVTGPDDHSHLRLVQSVESSHGDASLQQTVARQVGISEPPLTLDSQAKYGTVARGDAALYLRFPSPGHPNYREKIWDHAAGALIVEEAGGRVTDMHGVPLNLSSDYQMKVNRGVIVSNGLLHAGVLAACRQQA